MVSPVNGAEYTRICSHFPRHECLRVPDILASVAVRNGRTDRAYARWIFGSSGDCVPRGCRLRQAGHSGIRGAAWPFASGDAHPAETVTASCREGLSLWCRSRSGDKRSGAKGCFAPAPVSATGTALRSHLCVALSSVQVDSHPSRGETIRQPPASRCPVCRRRDRASSSFSARSAKISFSDSAPGSAAKR